MKQPFLIAVLLLMFACSGYQSDTSSSKSETSGVSFVKATFSEASTRASDADKMMLLDFFAVW